MCARVYLHIFTRTFSANWFCRLVSITAGFVSKVNGDAEQTRKSLARRKQATVVVRAAVLDGPPRCKHTAVRPSNLNPDHNPLSNRAALMMNANVITLIGARPAPAFYGEFKGQRAPAAVSVENGGRASKERQDVRGATSAPLVRHL